MSEMRGSQEGERMKRYWLTPPDLYAKLDAEFHFDFDPCPPAPEGLRAWDGLSEWGQRNFVNPPFRKKDGSPTGFVRKAIEQQRKGKTSVLLLPTQSYVNLLLEAGAELRSLGRVRWVAGEDGEPMRSPSPITVFILRGRVSG